MTRLKKSGFAGPILGPESGTTDCGAASAARANDSSAMGIKVRLSIIRIGANAASVFFDWIRLGTFLLYTGTVPECSGGCQSVNGNLFPKAVVETEGRGRSSRGNQSVCDSIIRGDVGKDFANSEDPAARRTFRAGTDSARQA